MATKGRPKKSTVQHKLDGTYQACRHKNNADVLLADILFCPEKISVPDEIKKLQNKKIETAFKNHVTMLIRLQSVYDVDMPDLTNLYIVLNDIYQLREAMSKIDVLENFSLYEKMQKLFLKQVVVFNTLGSKFFLTPQSRTQMTLGNLQALNENLKLQERIRGAEQNPVQKLIHNKKN